MRNALRTISLMLFVCLVFMLSGCAGNLKPTAPVTPEAITQYSGERSDEVISSQEGNGVRSTFDSFVVLA